VGYTFAGHAVAVPGPLGSIGEQLAGRVLARFSVGLSRGGERFGSLGLALRFRPGAGPPLDHVPAIEDQDLIFMSVPSLLALPYAWLLADARDFVGKRYWAVTPFTVRDHGRIELRLSPVNPPGGIAPPPQSSGSREARLRQAVAAGRAEWWLEARRRLSPRWHRVAKITIEQPIAIDDRALKFDVFRAGGGVMPVGFVNAVRGPTYDASQRARDPADQGASRSP
jgi:hypothetical protein